MLGVEPRAFVVQALDAAPGLLNAEVAAVLVGPAAVVNVSLPQAGSVFVNTLGEGSTVTLTSNASEPGMYLSATVDPDLGGALLSRVPLGRFAAHVCYAESPLACGATSGDLQQSAQPLEVEVHTPALVPDGFIGTLVAPDGVTPVANQEVIVTAGEATPASGAEYVVTDGAGQFRATVPIVAQGLLVASGGSSSFALSVQNGTDVGPLAFNLVLGSGIDAESNTLTGALSFRYTFSYDGSVQGGASPEIPSAFELYNWLRLNGLSLGGHLAASTELAGRQIAYAPVTMGGLQVTRKVYVPEDGSYVRYLEVLHNPTGGAIAGPITTDLQLVGQLAEPFRVVRSTTDTGGAYFVTDDGGIGAGRTVMADVLSANTGAATLFASVRMQLFGGYTTKRYTVTVPDGETRILMHFVVQRLAGDQAGAEAQALSLVNLTDPNMFFGLSASERAQVLNFRVP